MEVTWLVLDPGSKDDPTIRERLRDSNLHCAEFSQPQELTSFLIEQKRQGKLSSYKLMIEPYLPGNPMIFSPREWNGVNNFAYPTNQSLDAGFVFYENVIMNESHGPIWYPLPDTIFLSYISLFESPVHQRMASIARRWSKINNLGLERAQVRYVNKLDVNEGKVIF